MTDAAAVGPIPERPDVHRTEVDGVPTFWHPAPGPLRASLQFRVGRADEPMPKGGISHLVEHLALSALGERDHMLNGFVEAHRTAFVASGTSEEVTAFINDVTSALSDLPCERLKAERQVLAVEAHSRGASLAGLLLAFRYGATGIGKLGYNEIGLEWLEADHVKAWAARCFTKQNAALWLSGEPPDSLALSLPDGERMALSPSVHTDLGLPALYRHDGNLVGFSFAADRRREAAVVIRVAERRLQNGLRHEGGLSYQVATALERAGADGMHVLLAADVLPQNASAAMTVAERVFSDLADHGPTDEERQRDAQLMLKAMHDENAVLGWLDEFSRCELVGEPEPAAPSTAVDEILTTHSAEFCRIMSNAMDTLVAAAPMDVDVPDWGWAPDVWSRSAVQGRTFHTKAPRSNTRLVVGDDGVMLVLDEHRRVTVRYDQLAAMAWWKDGTRSLVGSDGFRIVVAPWDWAGGEEAVKLIDAVVTDDELCAPMGHGEGPPPPPPRRKRLRPDSLRFWGAWAIWVALSLLFASVLLAAPSPDPDSVPLTAPAPLDEDGDVRCGTRSNFTAVFGDFTPPVAAADVEEVKDACKSDAKTNLAIAAVAIASLLAAGEATRRRVNRVRSQM